MLTLIKNISSLATCSANGELFKTGSQMQNVGEIKNAAILFDSKIRWIGLNQEYKNILSGSNIKEFRSIDAANKAVIPGFIDSHTHLVFGGNRSDEFAKRMRGATYREIAEQGGGIQHTVRETRAASEEQLFASAEKLINNAIKHGTTAFETKSGYGLDTKTELKILRVIKKLRKEKKLQISSTFLGAHDFPPEYSGRRDEYIDLICEEMLPQVVEHGLAEFCDAFVDQGYYTIEQGEKIFQGATDLGLKLKVHADELACVNGAELAARMGAVSADHLLFISDSGIENMKKSGTIATFLPGTAYFIRLPYAPARKILKNGNIVALATDCNPGSCFTENMQQILSLATLNMNMTAEEALNAATINAAAAICKSDSMGSLEVGKDANFLVLDGASYTDIFYHFGVNHVSQTWINGELAMVNG
ncbi:MAG: imidazolonepropionase [Candidatus Kapabacteria bacterium]|nr:imidazolonepropionase [Candidatus Kapabacteria bacterium]